TVYLATRPLMLFFFSSRRRHTRSKRDWSSDVCSSDLPGIRRHDPNFMAAYVVNHVLGGGGLSSRLYKEVREKRGLAYSVYDALRSEERRVGKERSAGGRTCHAKRTGRGAIARQRDGEH